MARSFNASLRTTLIVIIITFLLINPIFGKVDLISNSLGVNNKTTDQILPAAYAAKFTLKLNQRVFVPNDTLIIYGTGTPNDTLLISLIGPSQRTVKIDSVTVKDDGTFFKEFLEWTQPTKNYVFGEYTVRVSSNAKTVDSQEVPIIFAEGLAQSSNAAIIHVLGVKLDSPTQVTTSQPFRIFVQVTYDGALVNSDQPDLLGSSHVHSGNQTINLAGKFVKLHEGIYYADVILPNDGTYIIHAIAFYQGYESHDSKVVSASNSSISTIQQSVNDLNQKLESTNTGLVRLQTQLNKTDSTLQSADSAIRSSVESTRQEISNNLNQVKDASGQINSLIIPVLALISIIIALQISLFARIRASYR